MRGTFVTLGNATQPFPRMLRILDDATSVLSQPVFIQSGHTPWEASRGVTVVQFLSMEKFQRYIAESEVVIMHAGAGSVIQSIKVGKVPIVVPRRVFYGEHINDHQVEFANFLATEGKVIIVESAGDLTHAIESQRRSVLEVFQEPRLTSRVRDILHEYEIELRKKS